MDKLIEFGVKHGAVILPVVLFLVGVLIPKETVFSLGKRAGAKLPKKAAVRLAEYLDVLEQGLIGSTYNGDRSIVGNSQVSEAVNKIKIDLGLEESGSKKQE